jgi:hypothetical protein
MGNPELQSYLSRVRLWMAVAAGFMPSGQRIAGNLSVYY